MGESVSLGFQGGPLIARSPPPYFQVSLPGGPQKLRNPSLLPDFCVFPLAPYSMPFVDGKSWSLYPCPGAHAQRSPPVSGPLCPGQLGPHLWGFGLRNWVPLKMAQLGTPHQNINRPSSPGAPGRPGGPKPSSHAAPQGGPGRLAFGLVLVSPSSSPSHFRLQSSCLGNLSRLYACLLPVQPGLQYAQTLPLCTCKSLGPSAWLPP